MKEKSTSPVKCPSPLPGTENYDLYRTLASPSDKDFDSQSSILGSISSKETTFAVGVPEDSRVIHSRGSSDPTSDIETSQSSVLAAPPSEIHVSPDIAFDTDELDEKEKSPPKKLEPILEESDITEKLIVHAPTEVELSPKPTKRLTRRAMKSPPLNVIEAPPVPLKTTSRATRNNNNGNITVEETKPAARAIKSYSRKRKNVQPAAEEESTPAITLTSPTPAVTSPSSQTTVISSNFDQNSIPHSNSESSNNNWSVVTNKLSEIDSNEPIDFKLKSKIKKCWYDQDIHSDSSSQEKDNRESQQMNIEEAKMANMDSQEQDNQANMDTDKNDKLSVKLVITKKKGSIFRSRALADKGMFIRVVIILYIF